MSLIAVLTSKIFLAAFVGFSVGAMDLAVALKPDVQSNGIFHWFYLTLKGAQKSDGGACPADPAK